MKLLVSIVKKMFRIQRNAINIQTVCLQKMVFYKLFIERINCVYRNRHVHVKKESRGKRYFCDGISGLYEKRNIFIVKCKHEFPKAQFSHQHIKCGMLYTQQGKLLMCTLYVHIICRIFFFLVATTRKEICFHILPKR